MKKPLALFFILNVLDAATTIYGISWLGFTELNPLMALAYAVHPIVFVAVKFGVVIGAIFFARNRPDHKPTLFWVNCVFAAVVVWNTLGIILHWVLM